MKFIRIQHKKSSQFSGDQEDFRRPRTFLRKPRRFQETKEISEDQGDFRRPRRYKRPRRLRRP